MCHFLFRCHNSYKLILWMNVVWQSSYNCCTPENSTIIFLLLMFVLDKSFHLFSALTSGRSVPLVTTCPASDWVLDHPHTYCTLTRLNAAIRKDILIVTNIVTIKMSAIRSTTRVGVNAKRQDISWRASTKAVATTFTALKRSDAARWRNVICILLFQITS